MPVSERLTNGVIQRTFMTTLLLSGSAERAEAAVLEAIRCLDTGDASGETLLWHAIGAAIAPTPRVAVCPTTENDRAASSLPRELKRVLRLTTVLRQCFVLRIFAGLPREVCAHLLHLDVGQVDEGTCAAAQALAGWPS